MGNSVLGTPSQPMKNGASRRWSLERPKCHNGDTKCHLPPTLISVRLFVKMGRERKRRGRMRIEFFLRREKRMFLRRTGPNWFFSGGKDKRQNAAPAAFGSGFVRGEESKDSNQKVAALGNPSVQNSEEAGKVGICFCAPSRQEGKQKRGENSKVPEKCQRRGIGVLHPMCEDAKSNPKEKNATRFCHCPGGIKFRRGDLNAREEEAPFLDIHLHNYLVSLHAFPLSRGSVSQKFRLTQQSPTHAFSEKGSLFAIRFFHHDTCGKTRVRSFQKHVGRRAH